MEEKGVQNAIKNKPFINMTDMKIILGGMEGEASEYMVKKFFSTIRKLAVEDLGKKGLIIPSRKIIPASYVWDYLKPYGISK